VFNTFERLVGLGSITRDEQRTLFNQFKDDTQEGRLVVRRLELGQAFSDAYKLSLAHTAKVLTRSLDLLHVAAAQQIGCTTFVTADRRQLAVAKAVGMRVVDITRPRRQPK
jgi:predicted nucleic acid-binding protein